MSPTGQATMGGNTSLVRRELFRQFVRHEIEPYAGGWDRDERMPPEAIHKFGEAGFLGALIPQEYGGMGMDMSSFGVLNEEVGRGCSSARSLLTVHSMVSHAILKWGAARQRERWLPELASGGTIAAFALTERLAGSDIRAIETAAVLRDGTFVVNGHKKWITFGQTAGLFLVFAQCDGKPVALLLERDRPGLSIAPLSGLLGTRASMLGELTFSECEVPAENVVGAPGFGLSAVAGTALDLGRYSVASGCVGIAQACLDSSLAFAASREQFGAMLRDHQLISAMISRMIANVKAARLLCQNAGKLRDSGDPDSVAETLVAKYFASRAAMKAASDAVQIHGAKGCSPEYSVERYFRDSKIMEIIEGSTQILELMIAKQAVSAVGAFQ